MYFQQFYLACLSHASYMIGSDGIAAVVDPQRDVAIYLQEAQQQNLSIQYIIETHLHADFVSGHRELASLTGGTIYIGHRAGADFPHIAVRDGDELSFGHCRLRIMETPGHSIDSISILVTDLDRSPEAFAILTGDTLFIGDVGRPDLARGKTPQEMARMLYHSLQEKLLKLPDDVQVYPAHGAGSLCGKQLSSERFSTIGKEKASNYALRAANEQEFIDLITNELPERPGYFATDREINRLGPQLLSELPALPALTPAELLSQKEKGALILDTQSEEDFTAAHLPGSLHIGLSGQFASWAGTLIGLEKNLILVTENRDRLLESRIRLARIGIEKIAGYLADGIAGWIREGLPIEQLPQISVEELNQLLVSDPGSIQVIDVRRPQEWENEHIQDAVLLPLHNLAARMGELDRNRPLAVHCQSGYRSTIALSMLQSAGFKQVFNVAGGFDAWRTCKLPFVSALKSAA